MKKANLANLMIKAIRKFTQENKTCEIRNVYAWEFGGNSALFNVEYVDADGEYHEIQIDVKEVV